MSMIKVKPEGFSGNKLFLYFNNKSTDRMWFKCYCRVYDSSGNEINILPNNNVPNPNLSHEINGNDDKKLSIDLDCDIHDDMLFVCKITEKLAEIDAKKSTSKYKFRLTHKWLQIEEWNN